MNLDESELLNNVVKVSNLLSDNKICLPDKPGLYVFWWIDGLEKLFNANLKIVLKGPGASYLKLNLKIGGPKNLSFLVCMLVKQQILKSDLLNILDVAQLEDFT